MILTIVFVVLSLLLLAFTILRPYRHRFFRFFAFESVLGLVLLNADTWFLDPASPIQIISWSLLIGSFLLALHGFQMLRSHGAPRGDIEDTTQLVTSGAYHFIRHPLYCSLLLLGAGAFLKDPSWLGLFVLMGLIGFLYVTGRVEEKDNLERFGAAYHEYMKKTRMFIPFIF